MPEKKRNPSKANVPPARPNRWLVNSRPGCTEVHHGERTNLRKDLVGSPNAGKLDSTGDLACQNRIDTASDHGLAELFDYAGMRAEEVVHPWFEDRRRRNLGPDASGGARVLMVFTDRSLLNAAKRAGAVRKGTFSGTWILKRYWAHPGSECGVHRVMAEEVCRVLNTYLSGRAYASVEKWRS